MSGTPNPLKFESTELESAGDEEEYPGRQLSEPSPLLLLATGALREVGDRLEYL